MSVTPCPFLIIDDTEIPGVNSVTESPAYVLDAQRTLSGMLRVEHAVTAREWRVELRRVSGPQLATLRSFLATPSPRMVEVMGGAVTAALVTVDQVQMDPKFTAPQDLTRASVTLMIRELLPSATPTPPGTTTTADATTVTADSTAFTADAA